MDFHIEYSEMLLGGSAIDETGVPLLTASD